MNTQALLPPQTGVWIVGAGTFAVKLSTIMEGHGIVHGFVDRQRTEPLCQRPVLPLDEVLDPRAIYLVAVSFAEIATEIKQQLVNLGISAGRVVLLLEESSANVLEIMLTRNASLTMTLLDQGVADFCELEQQFFADQYQSLSAPLDQRKIAFCYIGNGGGFRKHVQDLPYVLAQHYQVKTFSDQPSTACDRAAGYCIMSELSMMQNQWPDFVINPHFFECSPAPIPKLTMMHMVYDFLLYKDLVARVMGQPDTHYIFIPSVPSFELHKQICFDYGLKNNLVLIPGGYPRFDQNLVTYNEIKHEYDDSNCILYAPTLSAIMETDDTAFTYSIYDAVEFIDLLLSAHPDLHVIFRPHPDDLAVIRRGVEGGRTQAFRTLLHWCDSHPRVHLDDNQGDYLATFANCFAMISDTSAIAYSFALTTGKPVIFYSHDQQKVSEIFAGVKYISDRDKIGFCVDTPAQLLEVINQCRSNPFTSSSKAHFVNSIVFNKGHSFQYLKDSIDDMVNGRKRADWWYLQDHI